MMHRRSHAPGGIKRKLAIALLACGVVGGFASGFASLHCKHRMRGHAFDRYVRSVCTEAARQVAEER